MSKTKRVNPEWDMNFHKTNTEVWKSPDHDSYIPHRHLSKAYQAHDIWYKGLEYNGHKPCKGAKQRLTQELRAKEKEEVRNLIDEELNED